jgi:WD40 repeat protein
MSCAAHAITACFASEVDSVDFHGDTVISGSFDSTVRFWDVKTGECTNVLKEAGSILMVLPTAVTTHRHLATPR